MFYYPYVITEMARMLIGIVVFFVVFVLDCPSSATG